MANSSLELLAKLQQLLGPDTASSESEHSQSVRLEACGLARKLWLELEEPGNLIDRIIFQTQENAILRLGLDLGIYERLVQCQDTLNSNDIAKETGADPVLVERILRNLAALDHVEEVGHDTYRANKITKAFTTPKGVSGAIFSHDFVTPGWNQIPSFLKANGYQNPIDSMNTPVQRAFNSPKHFFELLVDQDALNNFQTLMSSYRTGRAEFLDVFPAEDRLIKGAKSDRALLVDVGGGLGHDLRKFADKFPRAEGRLILQDQPDVIKQVSQTDTMECMVHDFFTPQPVKGARCYYMRMILHDWPDAKCVEILEHLASAMEPGYSKLCVNDIVLPDKGATRFATQSDLNMMAMLAACERSESQWRTLLQRAGLEVVRVWPGTPEGVIEAMLPSQ